MPANPKFASAIALRTSFVGFWRDKIKYLPPQYASRPIINKGGPAMKTVSKIATPYLDILLKLAVNS